MSRAPCLFALSLLLPACIEPAIQGTTAPPEGTSGPGSDAGTSGEGPGGESETGTAGATEASPTSGEPAPPGCGDGALDEGEQCDDGDDDDADDCTRLCAPPSCDDGIVSGGETDVDCGGPCTPCAGGQLCAFPADCASGVCQPTMQCLPLKRSCLELLGALPGLIDGTYPIDPDGDFMQPFDAYCDMKNGGWTRVFLDDFAPQQPGWDKTDLTECGEFGEILGGAGEFGAGASARLETTALGVEHGEMKLVVEAIVLDSWDAERVRVLVEDVEIAAQLCTEADANQCNQFQNVCGQIFRDGEIKLAPDPFVHTDDAIVVVFESTLNEDANNEAWGLDRVEVLVK